MVKQGFGETQGWEFKEQGKNAPFVWYRYKLDLRGLINTLLYGSQVTAVALKGNCWLGKKGDQVILIL